MLSSWILMAVGGIVEAALIYWAVKPRVAKLRGSPEVPQLPPPQRLVKEAVPSEALVTYRTPGQLAEPPTQRPKPVSFNRFVTYCQANGTRTSGASFSGLS